MSELSRSRVRIGYALAPKKVESLIQPSFVDLAKERGIELVPIDTAKPLIEQGPFDCVIHKLYGGEEWKKQLDEFCSENHNRDVVVIDPLDAIERLHNRISMLEVVTELKIAPQPQERRNNETATFGIPRQLLIHDSESLSSDLAKGLNFHFPVIAKPLSADGSAKSHNMSLVFNEEGLKGLKKPPIVLQEFVNHGGVLFKVYVVGSKYVQCVKRRSLPDISKEDMLGASASASGGLMSFSQISNLASCRYSGDDAISMLIEEAEMPPLSFVTEIANGLQQALGLHLFNFDMIRDTRVGNRYLVIDINYFPGYEKLPSYETVLTDFFWDIVHQKRSESQVRRPTSLVMNQSQESRSDFREMPPSCDKEEEEDYKTPCGQSNSQTHG